jgi:hypothetical protein
MAQLAAWLLNQPPIAYHQARQAWFLYDGKMYSVSRAPSIIFRSAVFQAVPSARSISVMRKTKLDMVERWYVLLHITNGIYPFRLYSFTERRQFCRT